MQKISATDAQLTTHPTILISMLVVAVFFSMGSRAVFSPLMPGLQADMDITLSTAGSLFLIISVSYAATMLFSGFLSARIGHGMTIVASLAVISLGLFLSGLAQGIGLLGTGMLLIGAGSGAYPPSAVAMINTKIAYQRRSTAFSFHEIGPNMSLLLIPMLAVILDPWAGWRGVLFLMAAICALSAVAFFRWGAMDGGVGAVPALHTVSTILKIPEVYVGMILLSATLAGLHGVYAIVPAYLVSEHGLAPSYVNILLAISRVSSVVLLLFAGQIINRFGKRMTITWVLIFTSVFTALIGIARGPAITPIILLQPALLAVVTPALLASVGDIGESSYQNITYALIITVGVSFGGGVAPAFIGLCGDLQVGWLGFLLIGLFMLASLLVMRSTPTFGQEK